MTAFRIGLVACAALVAAAKPAGAADYRFSGSISYHNDVVQIDFTLATAASNVRIWTDSWQSGLNFDPTAALWSRSGSGYALLAVADDDDTVAAGQGYYDTGFQPATLAAGQYRVTLGAAFNAPAGTLLSQGFAYDGQTPILLTQWNQPSYDPNANDQKGGFWRLNLSGVTQAAVVPEPGAALMLALGLAVLATRRRPARGVTAW